MEGGYGVGLGVNACCPFPRAANSRIGEKELSDDEWVMKKRCKLDNSRIFTRTCVVWTGFAMKRGWVQTGVEIFLWNDWFGNGTEDQMERLEISDASIPASHQGHHSRNRVYGNVVYINTQPSSRSWWCLQFLGDVYLCSTSFKDCTSKALNTSPIYRIRLARWQLEDLPNFGWNTDIYANLSRCGQKITNHSTETSYMKVVFLFLHEAIWWSDTLPLTRETCDLWGAWWLYQTTNTGWLV